MTSKTLILRSVAQRDLESAIDYYIQQAGAETALRFIDAVEHAYILLSSHPAAGSSRYAFELSLPGLRNLKLARFPYLLFYIDQDTHIEIWRVLHEGRDIPSQILEEEER